MISASVVSTISLTYSGSNPWTVFDSANLATGGTLQANWNDIASQLNGLYKPLLNSAVDEIGILNVSAVYAGSAAYSVSAATAANANTLDSLHATSFARVDSIPTFSDGASG